MSIEVDANALRRFLEEESQRGAALNWRPCVLARGRFLLPFVLAASRVHFARISLDDCREPGIKRGLTQPVFMN
jgi:hypothetical protein